MCYLKAQAQLEYALLIGAIVAAMIAVIYARKADFARLPNAISTVGNLNNITGEITETD